jgi:hypothetical protein
MEMHAVIEKEERDQTPIGEALHVRVKSPLGPIRQKALFADTLLGTNGGQRGQRDMGDSRRRRAGTGCGQSCESGNRYRQWSAADAYENPRESSGD